MADTYTLISSVTVGAGGASSIDFTSIPSTYTDLVLKLSARGTRVNTYDTVSLTFNNSSAAAYNQRRIYGGGAGGTGSDGSTNTTKMLIAIIDAASSTSTTFSNTEIYVPNYTSSNNKSLSVDGVEEENNSTAYVQLTAGLWSNTSSINQITLITDNGNFAQYSTAYLYGIKNS